MLRALPPNSPLVRKAFFALSKLITSPRTTLSWVIRGYAARDSVFLSQTFWISGTLPRVSLSTVLPGVRDVDIIIPRTFDRRPGTSITVEEACHLAAIAKHLNATKCLEIGTADGNTTLVLAANIREQGSVVTVDLPPNFDLSQQNTLTFPVVGINLTEREQLGRQFKNYELSRRIRQVFGDSAALDWATLGGPFELIFIDGCHFAEYVTSDSNRAMKHLAPGGVIVWHDYGMIDEVSMAVDQFAHDNANFRIHALEGTRLAIAVPISGDAGPR